VYAYLLALFSRDLTTRCSRRAADARVVGPPFVMQNKLMAKKDESNRDMPLVIIESPYAGDVDTNIRYARSCMRDSLKRGESPFVMHLLYTQEGILDDDIPEERSLGIEAGLAWGKHASKTVVYTDLGITPGMEKGIQRAKEEEREIEYRELDSWVR